ncbi:MAG: nodulation protein NfeD [Acidobacteria bacterium]|nr:nodulation protein NfeD [Acidobacteriota bacterium]
MFKKSVFVIFCALGLLFGNFGYAGTAAPVAVIHVRDTIQPVSAQFILDGLKDANSNPDTRLIIIMLDTPGGLLASTRDITGAILSSGKPVAVYVHPAGGRAASAGFFILLSADFAAMTPGTNAGAAHPVSAIPFLNGNPEKKGSGVMEDKMVEDTAAFIRAIAEKRNRAVEPAELAVRKSIAYSARECYDKHLINFLANSTEDLVHQISAAHPDLNLPATGEVKTRDYRYSFREKLLSRLASPELVFLLLLAGVIGLFIEMKTPGAVFPGLFGAICLILFFFSTRIIPVNFAGILFIIMAVVLFVMEVKVVSYGFLTIGGIVSMIIGSAMLFKHDLPGMGIPMGTVFAMSLFVAVLVILLVRLVLKAHMNQPMAGKESLVGMAGFAVQSFEKMGKVFVNGEYWNAITATPVEKDQEIEVVKIANMILHVKLKEE